MTELCEKSKARALTSKVLSWEQIAMFLTFWLKGSPEIIFKICFLIIIPKAQFYICSSDISWKLPNRSVYKFVPIWILLNDVTITIFIKDYESHQIEHWCNFKYDRRLYNKEEVLGKYSRKRKKNMKVFSITC